MILRILDERIRKYGLSLVLRVGLCLLVGLCTHTGVVSVAYAASVTSDDCYYVNNISGSDANPGTQLQPWQTIQKAADKMAPGNTLIVPAGVYNERILITRSGAPGAPITYRAEGKVTIRGFTVYASYINIIGFEITDTDNNWVNGWGIYVKGSNCLIENNYVYDCTHGGIKLAHDVNNPNQTSNCIVRNNRLYHNSQLGVEVHGRYHLVEGNEVWRSIQYHPKWPNPPSWVDADGMRYFGGGHVFRGNYIHDISFNDPENVNPHIDCFQSWSDDRNEAGFDIVFERNYCKVLEPPGAPNAATRGLLATSGARNLTLKNNIFMAFIATTFEDSPNNTIVNNTFVSMAKFPDGSISNGLELIRSSNATVKNNIFYGIGNLAVNAADGTSKSGLDAGYNCVYRDDGKAPKGSPYPNDLWNVNPQFVDARSDNFQLREGSPLVDAGKILVYVYDDFGGNPRPQVKAHDVGAYERSLSAPVPSPTPGAPEPSAGMYQVFIPAIMRGAE